MKIAGLRSFLLATVLSLTNVAVIPGSPLAQQQDVYSVDALIERLLHGDLSRPAEDESAIVFKTHELRNALSDEFWEAHRKRLEDLHKTSQSMPPIVIPSTTF